MKDRGKIEIFEHEKNKQSAPDMDTRIWIFLRETERGPTAFTGKPRISGGLPEIIGFRDYAAAQKFMLDLIDNDETNELINRGYAIKYLELGKLIIIGENTRSSILIDPDTEDEMYMINGVAQIEEGIKRDAN